MTPYRPIQRQHRRDPLITCPVCDGHTEVHGRCTGHPHLNCEPWPCPACKGIGRVRRSLTLRTDWCALCGLSAACHECQDAS